MGTVCACGDGCALLVPFHWHSTGLRRWLCPPGSISWAQHRLAAMAVPSWFHFMGTAQACGDGCALLVSFHGHSTGLRRWLCPPSFISWAQHRLAAMAVSSSGSARHKHHISIKKCPDHIFPDPGTFHYQIINSLIPLLWHYRYTTGNICPSER